MKIKNMLWNNICMHIDSFKQVINFLWSVTILTWLETFHSFWCELMVIISFYKALSDLGFGAFIIILYLGNISQVRAKYQPYKWINYSFKVCLLPHLFHVSWATTHTHTCFFWGRSVTILGLCSSGSSSANKGNLEFLCQLSIHSI